MKVRGGRAILNLPGFETTAAIVAEVEDTSGWAPGEGRDGTPLADMRDTAYSLPPEHSIVISDCDRRVSLDVSWDNPAAMANSRRKIATLIRCLQSFEEGLIEEQRLFKERLKQVGR